MWISPALEARRKLGKGQLVPPSEKSNSPLRIQNARPRHSSSTFFHKPSYEQSHLATPSSTWHDIPIDHSADSRSPGTTRPASFPSDMRLSTFVLSAVLAVSSVQAALDAKLKAKGRAYYGNIIDTNTINTAQVTNILNTEFGAVTPENAMKWDATEPSRGQFRFTNADAVANWATSRGKLLRGHTLVWHSQLPGWVSSINDKNTLTQVIQNHINQVAGRYKGKVYAWDVVNEVLEDNGQFRNSVFYRVLGEEFIDIAFRTARTADPTAKLYINDYNLDYAGPKINATLALVERLRARGTPIDGIGSQSHLIVGNLGGFEEQLVRLGETGLDVAITELDIRIAKPVDSSKLAQQQKDYETVTRACLNVPKCVGITIWGVSDRNSWVDSTFPSYDAPLLWDDNYNRKSAYNGADVALN
ncbi:hypothetical protein NMY22_g17769 [Coprinellus aureogranulatus]|nr:hypothetical protein NMY22_g17769 [Coprinellus aureogranulatus]